MREMDKEEDMRLTFDGANSAPSVSPIVSEIDQLRRELSNWRGYGIIEVMIRNQQVNEFVRDKEREIARLVSRLREAFDYVTDATEHWPRGSLEHEVAMAIEARCRVEIESYPPDGAEPDKV